MGTSHVSADLGPSAVEVSRQAAARSRTWDLSPAIRCPECEAPLERVEDGRSKVPIDVCRNHGVWFDKSELEKIQTAARPAIPPPFAGKALAAGGVAGAVAATGIASHSLMNPSSPLGANYPVSSALSGAGEAVAEVAGGVVIEGLFEVLGGIVLGIFD